MIDQDSGLVPGEGDYKPLASLPCRSAAGAFRLGHAFEGRRTL